MEPRDWIARLETATSALEGAISRADLDGVEAALAVRERALVALGEARARGALPEEVVQRAARLLEGLAPTQRSLEALATGTREELDRVRRAKSIAGALAPGRGPARFVNERI